MTPWNVDVEPRPSGFSVLADYGISASHFEIELPAAKLRLVRVYEFKNEDRGFGHIKFQGRWRSIGW